MAKEGMKLTDFYGQFDRLHPFPIGTPDGLLRGPHRNGKERGLPRRQAGTEPEGNNHRRDPEEGGYATGCFGKWIWAIKRPSCRKLKDSTNTRAFPIPTTCGSEETRNESTRPCPIKGNKPVAHIPDHHSQALITDAITDAAVHFINQNKDKPFFCHASLRRSLPTWSPSRLAKAEGDAMRALVSTS